MPDHSSPTASHASPDVFSEQMLENVLGYLAQFYELGHLIASPKRPEVTFSDVPFLFAGKRWCRYCQKNVEYDNITFGEILAAHLVPALFGDSQIYSFTECEACNKYLGKLEAHLGTYVSFQRSVARVETRPNNSGNTYRQHSAPGERVKVITDEESGNQIYISDHLPEIDEAEKRFDMSAGVKPFVPLKAWKALARIGFGMLPVGDVGHFEILRQTIMTEVHDEEFSSSLFHLCFVTTTLVPGPSPVWELPTVVFYKRSCDTQANGPYRPAAFAAVQFGNLQIQVFLPSDADVAAERFKYDERSKSDSQKPTLEMGIPFLPINTVDYSIAQRERFGPPQLDTVPMNSKEVAQGVVHGATHGFNGDVGPVPAALQPMLLRVLRQKGERDLADKLEASFAGATAPAGSAAGGSPDGDEPTPEPGAGDE